MSAPAYITERRTDPDGTVATRKVAYVPPAFPLREFIILERDTNTGILVCPGSHELERPGQEALKRAQRIKDVYHGYRPLRHPADIAAHATRMTESEAIEFCRSKKWTNESHRITKSKTP